MQTTFNSFLIIVNLALTVFIAVVGFNTVTETTNDLYEEVTKLETELTQLKSKQELISIQQEEIIDAVDGVMLDHEMLIQVLGLENGQ